MCTHRAYGGDDHKGSVYLQAFAHALETGYRTKSLEEIHRTVRHIVSRMEHVSTSRKV